MEGKQNTNGKYVSEGDQIGFDASLPFSPRCFQLSSPNRGCFIDPSNSNCSLTCVNVTFDSCFYPEVRLLTCQGDAREQRGRAQQQFSLSHAVGRHFKIQPPLFVSCCTCRKQSHRDHGTLPTRFLTPDVQIRLPLAFILLIDRVFFLKFKFELEVPLLLIPLFLHSKYPEYSVDAVFTI